MGSLKEVIQRCGQTGMPELGVAVITNMNPLQMVLKNDSKIQLSAVSLVIPDRIKNRLICSGHHVDCVNGCDACTPRPMRIGDEFYVLSLNNGKLYYVLDWK